MHVTGSMPLLVAMLEQGVAPALAAFPVLRHFLCQGSQDVGQTSPGALLAGLQGMRRLSNALCPYSIDQLTSLGFGTLHESLLHTAMTHLCNIFVAKHL